MDKSAIIGIVAGLALVIGAIFMGSGIGMFISVPSLLIVAGGTVAATAVAFPGRELKWIAPVTARVFRNPKQELLALARFLLDCRKAVAKDGPLALEKLAEEANGPVANALRLVADGTEPGALKEILSTEQRIIEEHHRAGQKIYSEMGKFAPAFGMIGTLIGLVQMLATLDDPSTIGPKMAVALLTTFYGAVMANLFFLPMVTKLERRLKVEATQLQLTLVAAVAINREDSIAVMREKLKAFLSAQGAADEDLETK